MGAGGDGSVTRKAADKKKSLSIEKVPVLTSVKDDLTVLRYMWFGKPSGSDHAARLESFYGPQAKAYDKFRANFLWGRKPMLAACAARLKGRKNLVWVDLGGGTGENVDMMSKFIPLENFKAVYVVDLCHSLCEVSRQKVKSKGWKNVHVVEGDACAFRPPEGQATLITFSYSLTMIPPFHQVVDQAESYLSGDGYMGVTDFFVSGRFDLPLRQMPWHRRFFWRSIFDIDNIDIGPERRAYLETKLERVYERNSEGSIPYVPYLRAPYYIWIGQKHTDGHATHDVKVERPPLFPPTFLYTQSWEDPEPDMKVMDINPSDTVLTLTSGGCNALNLLVNGAGKVVSVDCNPAQSSLLELKKVAIQQLDHADVWKLFGEGRHPQAAEIFEDKLAPFLSETAYSFWSKRLWYFQQGLYYQGGMGKLCWVLQIIFRMLGLGKTMERLTSAPTIEEQRKVWDSNHLVHFIKHGPKPLVHIFRKIVTFALFNRAVLWFGGGVPMKQLALILADNISVDTYIARTLDGVAENSCLRHHNYFYYNCLMGKFLPDNCPTYLTATGFQSLKAGKVDSLVVSTNFFLDELRSRIYTKVILMDHVDWLDLGKAQELATALREQVAPGGIVIWRSASLNPPYASLIRTAGFEIRRVSSAEAGYMDRVNMYSSFFVAQRKPLNGAAAAVGKKQ
uniref:Betaine lipid synthase n=1 Tax=Polytomella parva TaxID=51329 RepID=A0A7S0URH5_9CHLO|eukprot:CAMPEP_0175055804 /NCGR_PEP_ID=MMETSP0052_2-20121109/10295_1 /TAXON_ID=51329 ORGANISM="Polytomella parva, Strain SAG 63-3" /NCGR_SAMPLE_ID=MMETSP0052_2 /ASSEMBLY_ACC=CAM_ASM_000194 /LENGTH=677 /DNA_ID=CAMNT_0016320713 /DNA_START=45 /DNA_END=2075 /DNA_ORIENTATION=+